MRRRPPDDRPGDAEFPPVPGRYRGALRTARRHARPRRSARERARLYGNALRAPDVAPRGPFLRSVRGRDPALPRARHRRQSEVRRGPGRAVLHRAARAARARQPHQRAAGTPDRAARPNASPPRALAYLPPPGHGTGPDEHERTQRRARALVQRHADPHVVAWLAIAEFDIALGGATSISPPVPAPPLPRPASRPISMRCGAANGSMGVWRLRGARATPRCSTHSARAGIRRTLRIRGRCSASPSRSRRTHACSLATSTVRGAVRRGRRDGGGAACRGDARPDPDGRRVRGDSSPDDADARERLQTAFGEARARQCYDTFDSNPRFGATMCAVALEQGVETEFVRRVVELNALAPPPEAGRHWPWAVTVDTLGAFTVMRRGQGARVPRQGAAPAARIAAGVDCA